MSYEQLALLVFLVVFVLFAAAALMIAFFGAKDD